MKQLTIWHSVRGHELSLGNDQHAATMLMSEEELVEAAIAICRYLQAEVPAALDELNDALVADKSF